MASDKSELIKILSSKIVRRLILKLAKKIPLLGSGPVGFVVSKILGIVVEKAVAELETLRADMLISREVNDQTKKVVKSQDDLRGIGETTTEKQTKEIDQEAIDSYRDLFNV